MQIRNPLGDADPLPKMPYSKDDPFWTNIENEEKDRLEYWRVDDGGVFYVEWGIFINVFTDIAIAQINDNANYLSDTLKVKDKPVFFNINLQPQGLTNFHFIVGQTGRRKLGLR